MENHLKKLVEVRLKTLGKSAAGAAAEVDLGRTFINDILVERKRSVRPDAIEQLARALEVEPEEISLAQRGVWLDRWEQQAERLNDYRLMPLGAVPELPPNPAAPADTMIFISKNVPLIGLAMGSVLRSNIASMVTDNQPIDYVWRPPALTKARDIYAMLIVGDSMAPMHPPGELRFVNPHRPAENGDTVVVRTRNWEGDAPQTLIKILRRRTADKLVLEQLNPSATVEIPFEVVESVHRVLTTRELFGL